MSALVAGLQKDIQKFPRRTAQLNSGMLFVAMAALAMPVIFSLSQFGTFTIHAYEVIVLSRWTSGVLIVVYCLGLVRTLLATSPPARGTGRITPTSLSMVGSCGAGCEYHPFEYIERDTGRRD